MKKFSVAMLSFAGVFTLFFTIILFAAGCSSDGGGGGDGGGGTPIPPPETPDISSAPGAAFEVAPRLNALGAPISETTHPLASLSINSIPQIFTVGVNYNSSGYKPNFYRGFFESRISSAASEAWNELPKKIVSGDFDGDGYDDIVTAVFNASALKTEIYFTRRIDYQPQAVSQKAREIAYANPSDSPYPNAQSAYDNIVADYNNYTELVAGDFDGDGKKEIILYVSPYLYFLEVTIDNDSSADFTDMTGARDETFAYGDYVRFATADYDLDGKDEYVQLTSNKDMTFYRFYADYTFGSDHPENLSDWIGGPYSDIGVATYDLNEDGLPDTILSVANSNSTTIVITEADLTTHKPVFTTNKRVFSNAWLGRRIAVGKTIEGTIIMGQQRAINYTNGVAFLSFFGDTVSMGEVSPYSNVVAGDIDGDDYTDFIMLGKYPNAVNSNDRNLVKLIRYNGGAANGGKLGWGTNNVLPSGWLTDATVPTNHSYLAIGNFYPDTTKPFLTIKKLVGHKLLFTRPQIISVLVSPPYWDGSQNRNGGTSFGKSVTQSSGNQHAVGMSAGMAVGAKFDALMFGEVTAKVTLEGGFHKGWAEEISKTVSIGDSIGTGEDLVVFSSAAYDVFYYEIADSYPATDGNDDPVNLTNEIISVAVPRSIKIYSLAKDTYNQWIQESIDAGVDPDGVSDPNISANYKIPNDANLGLGHTLGNPRSYPNKNFKNSLAQGFFSGSEATDRAVGISDTGTLDLGLSEAITNATTWDWNAAAGVEASVEGGLFAKVTAEAWAKVEYEGETSTSISTATYIEGHIPHISSAYFNSTANTTFSAGLMAYPVVDKNQKYTVVTYWVE
jgi:hypothetical protein